jgi:O-acetyl-ADP-ribose deacetylase (regulator of RNase III)/DNA-binding Xre family transcriptional regulator
MSLINMPLEIIREDITRLLTDAIVHSTNPKLKKGSGSSNAIFQLAGEENLIQALKSKGYCAPGQAIITPGFNLSAKYIIHTVGPVWKGGFHQEAKQLESCYRSSLECALKYNLKSIAFPLISAGTYGYPKDEALKIAISTIQSFLFEHEMMVYLVVYDKQVYQLSTQLFNSVKQYIDDNYVENSLTGFRLRDYEMNSNEKSYSKKFMKLSNSNSLSIDDFIEQLDKSFSETLLILIDKKNMTDVETYKRANISKAHFSKIRSHKDYRPTKTTVLAFCIALHLNLDESDDLLEKAGFSLSNSSKLDLIVKYFITQKNFDIFEINKVLFEYDQTLLGANTL